MILDFVANFILPPVIEALGGEAISRAYRWWTASDSSDHEAQLSNLRDSLKIIQSMIDDAERKQGKESDDPVRLWLQRLQRLAYDVEDVLDECDYEHLRCRVETLGEKKRKRSSFTSDIVDKIKDINVRFDELKERARLLNLVSREFHPTAMQLTKTDSMLGDSKVFGRGDDIERILDMLDDLREKQYLVSGVSIVGMGGLGKTTVARSIYKKAEEEKRYDLVAWLCVSDDFNEETILREMHEHFIKGGVPPSSINVLVEDLARELGGKTCLLILDDVWNKDKFKWIAFNSRLSGILRTTRNSIMVTTRDEEVALEMRKMNLMRNSMQIYEMPKLSDDECWSIIEERVLELSGLQSISPNLKDIGVDIAKKCGGLPLIATVIGGTLCSEIQKSAWEAIRDNDAWNLDSEDGKWILSILKISFDHLLPPLKKCFSYCSIFPKDFLIEKDDLVQLWMAQGYLQQHNESSMTMEEVGDAYFNYLLSNSLFQDVERTSYGDIKYCKMHDAVHDLALVVSKDETFIWKTGCEIDESASILHLRVKHDASEPPDIPANVLRRLRSLFMEGKKVGTVFNAMAPNLKSLRSLKVGPKMPPIKRCSSAEAEMLKLNRALLESLKFQRAKYADIGATPANSGFYKDIKKEMLHPALGELKHLRYFDISEVDGYALPESFCKLYNLQTFRPYESYDCVLQWPKDMVTNWVSLRHICFSSERNCLRGRIRHLTSLQTLPFFLVSLEEGGGIEELGGLTQLRGELEIGQLEHIHSRSEATKANLKEKTGIRQLKLRWINSWGTDCTNEQEEVLEGFQPHTNLKSLSIEGYMGRSFPSWMMSGGATFLSNNLVELELDYWDNCEHIPSLGLLPSLKSLFIYGFGNVKRMGHKFDTTQSNRQGRVESIKLFPALRLLYMYNLKSLEEWIEVDDDIAAGGKVESVFPCLEILQIENCPQLEICRLGEFSSHHKLSYLVIRKCNKLMDIPSMNRLSSIQTLRIEKCFNARSIRAECLPCLTSLKHLTMDLFCKELEEFPGLNYIHQLKSSLEPLTLCGRDEVKSLPDQLQHLTALKELTLEEFNKVEVLPNWLGNLTSLQELWIMSCPMLKKRCIRCIEGVRHAGEEWSKISHIPRILIDYKRIKWHEELYIES
ncbi:hypothetical protein SLA2020_079870 [Shorea laevis]